MAHTLIWVQQYFRHAELMGEAESAAIINFSLLKKKHKYGLDGAAYTVSRKIIVAEGKKIIRERCF